MSCILGIKVSMWDGVLALKGLNLLRPSSRAFFFSPTNTTTSTTTTIALVITLSFSSLLSLFYEPYHTLSVSLQSISTAFWCLFGTFISKRSVSLVGIANR